jgi:hypothetical protein
MVLEKASLTYYPNIVVAGDPIIDVYDDFIFPGGALNVYSNLKYFDPTATSFFPSKPFLHYDHPIKKSAYNCYQQIDNSFYAKTLVCSDYNKGFISSSSGTIYSDLLIVDSKYNSLSQTILDLASIKILKQTSTDVFKKNFLDSFDYIVLTDHSSKIICYEKSYKEIFSVTPPTVICQNDSGAGDVFLAVLSVFLHNNFDKQNRTVLIHAVREAAFWAAYSTTTPFTSNIRHINVHN